MATTSTRRVGPRSTCSDCPSNGEGKGLTPLRSLKDVLLLNDGRYSGGTTGLCIGQVAAVDGGPIAFVKDRDRIRVDTGITQPALVFESTRLTIQTCAGKNYQTHNRVIAADHANMERRLDEAVPVARREVHERRQRTRVAPTTPVWPLPTPFPNADD
jgi:dihydroxyacid dehydratase/phosphogluconate dehydratase